MARRNYGVLMHRGSLGGKIRVLLLCLLPSLVAPCLAQDDSAAVKGLVIQFQAEPVFWRQAELGGRIAAAANLQQLSTLEPWLTHKDRQVRGNVAWLFAKLGDQRGFDTLVGILADRSADRAIHEPAMAISDGNYDRWRQSPQAMQQTIYADRYYAVHLLGTLQDPRALDVLIPLLDHDPLNYNAAWAIGEIGGPRALPPLIAALAHQDPQVRVGAVFALERMRAQEAPPHLAALFDDAAVPGGAEQVPIGNIARRAAATIRASLSR